MSAGISDDPVVTPVSGGITVVGSSSASLTRLTAVPETDPEKTLPMRPMTSWMLMRHAVRLRLLTWRCPQARLKLIVAAVLVVMVASLLRIHDTDSRDTAQTDTTVPAESATPTSTGRPAPPLPGFGRAPVAAQEDPTATAPHVPSKQELDRLPKAVVGEVVDAALADPAPGVMPGTTVLHPVQDTAVYTEPGGNACAVLPPRQVLVPTWVPVIDRRAGWVLVMLPTRPHPGGAAAVGWIHLRPTVELAEGDRRVEIDTSTGRVSVLAELGGVTLSSTLGTAQPAGTAAPSAPAAGRRSFVAIGGQAAEMSWLLQLLWPFPIDTGRVCTGAFSTVSVPGLPASSPLGPLDAVGCVPAPPALRSALAQVPAGTVVLLR